MKITGLGHSAYILEMDSLDGAATIRILADPWLDDYIVGDLLGRFPRIRFDPLSLGPLDAIFLSHSHTDHLDPYSLTPLWKALEPKPVLLLPQSLGFLRALLVEFLPGARVLTLRHGDTTFLAAEAGRCDVASRGLEVAGFFNPELRATNEDDVMLLAARNRRESFVAESDALLPFYDPDLLEPLLRWLQPDEVETLCFLTVKNEGEATMAMLTAPDAGERERRLEACVQRSYEEIETIFTETELDDETLWSRRHVVRLVAGQGIAFPQAVDATRNRVLFPISIVDRVRMEREVAAENGFDLEIEPLVAGSVHRIEAGALAERVVDPSIELLDREEDRAHDPAVERFDDFPVAPVHGGERDTRKQKELILRCLNRRFLPHLIGARQPPVEHLLAAGDGSYTVRVRLGEPRRFEEVDYIITFERLRFTEVATSDRAPDEIYWASDLEDFLEGRCDEFSIFARRPPGGRAQRLWTCLGLPYLNNDLIEKKLRFHFERARRGLTSEAWVLPRHGVAPRAP